MGAVGADALEDMDGGAGVEAAEGLGGGGVGGIDVYGAGEEDVLFFHLAGGEEGVGA